MNKNAYISTIVILVIIVAVYFMWPKSPSISLNKDNADRFSTTTSDTKVTALSKSLTASSTQSKIMHTITLETSKGEIVFQTYDNDAPKTVENFVTLAGKNFYNGVIFHRVIKGFMIQGGDPTGTGRGGPGYTFADELDPSTDSYKNGYKRGVVAMANAGPDTNGSQFFIMHKDTPLPNNYSIFGHVISGMDVVDAIAESPTAPGDVPVEKIVINKVTVVEDKIK